MQKKPVPYFIILFLFCNFLIPIQIQNSEMGLKSPISQISPIKMEFNESRAFNNIQTQIDFGYRIPGTEAHQACSEWIYNHSMDFSSSQYIPFTIQGVPCRHVVHKFDFNKNTTIIFAAHFDSRAVAEKDPNPDFHNSPIDGANDGGSGVAVLLELARVIEVSTQNWSTNFWFLFIDAEDQGYSQGLYGIENWDWCEGSEWLVNDMKQNPTNYFGNEKGLANIEAFILLDMVGGENLEFIDESHSNDILQEKIFEVGQDLGYSHAFPKNPRSGSIIDDHVPFAMEGVNTIDLIIPFWDTTSGWPYHHTKADNITHIDPHSLKITGETILTFLDTYYSENSTNAINLTPSIGISGFPDLEAMILGVIIQIVSQSKRKKKEK